MEQLKRSAYGFFEHLMDTVEGVRARLRKKPAVRTGKLAEGDRMAREAEERRLARSGKLGK